jgi:hypothetical protein
VAQDEVADKMAKVTNIPFSRQLPACISNSIVIGVTATVRPPTHSQRVYGYVLRMVQTTQELHPSADPTAHNLPHSDSDRSTAPILSKKAQKKALKAERYAAQKLERRAREKEAKKEKKRVLAEKRAAGEVEENGDIEGNKRKRARVGGGNVFGGRIVLDLGFDSMMREKVGLVRQIKHPMHAIHVSRKSHHFARS